MQAELEPQSATPVLRREIPTGCFCSTALSDLKLPPDFHRLGAHALDKCKLLSLVDISDTTILEIREFTFANCVLLQRVMLPYTLHTIHSKAFMNCAALQELAIPPSLHYIACKAFLDCTVLRRLTQMPGKRTIWRGTCAKETAFALCPRWRLPQWLHLIRSGIRVGLGLSPNKPHRGCHLARALHQCISTDSRTYRGKIS